MKEKSRMKQTEKITVIIAVYSVQKSRTTPRKDLILFLYKYVHISSLNTCITHYSKDHIGL